MTTKDLSHALSRRERQIMDVVYQRGQATASEVQEGLAEAPSYSAVRALLAILVNKGFLKIEADGPRYLYRPTRPRQQAGRSALHQVMRTFFDGSVEKAVAAILDAKDAQLSKEEIDRLQVLIDQARKGEGKL
jgi:predicted transcriptional regulator